MRHGLGGCASIVIEQNVIRALLSILLIASAGSGSLPAQTPVQADRALHIAKEKFDSVRSEWMQPPDTAEVRGALQLTWMAERRWAAMFLKQHPRADRATWRNHPPHKGRDIPVDFQFAALKGGRVLVATDDGGLGTVFILGPGAHGLKTVWSITDIVPPVGLKNGDTLRDWPAEPSARLVGKKNWFPLAGNIGSLSPQSDGRARFYIDAIYAQTEGATVADQFSVWTWDGRNATPQYIRIFQVVAGQPVGLRIFGNRLLLREKGDWHSFYSCGYCQGRQRDLVLQVSPNGIREIAGRSVHPELDRIDALLMRILTGRPANEIASPEAVTMLRTQLSDTIADMKSRKPSDRYSAIGMLMDWRIRRGIGATDVCLALDNDFTDVFRLIGSRVTLVTPVRPDACKGAGSGD